MYVTFTWLIWKMCTKREINLKLETINKCKITTGDQNVCVNILNAGKNGEHGR